MELYLEIVSADVTKLRCSRAGLEWTPIQYGLCPHKKRGRETKGRASWKDRGRDWGDVSTSQGTPRLPATMRSKEKAWNRVSLRVCDGASPANTLTLDFPAQLH